MTEQEIEQKWKQYWDRWQFDYKGYKGWIEQIYKDGLRESDTQLPLIKVKEPILVTEDKISIADPEQEIYGVDNWWRDYTTYAKDYDKSVYTQECKWFSIPDARKQYIKANKPLLTYQEVSQVLQYELNNHGTNPIDSINRITQAIQKLIDQKIDDKQ